MLNVDQLISRMSDPAFFLTQEYTDLTGYLRKHEPVRWGQPWPDRGAWIVSRYSDLKAVYEQPEIFSSEEAGNFIPVDPNFCKTDRDAKGFGHQPAHADPPHHGELRGVFARSFSGPQVAKLEKKCQAIVDDVIDSLQDRTEFEFVQDAAGHLPARLICQLLGVPEQDLPLVGDYVNSFSCSSDPRFQLGATPAETFQISMDWTYNYIANLVEERRRDPRDDLCSLAALAEVEGGAFAPHEAAWGAWTILAAGFETSRNAMAGGLLAMIQNPDQAELFVSKPGMVQPALDEIMRWTRVTTANLRVAKAETEIAGQKIAKGDWVFLMIDSANHDESVFADPFRFDITRRPNPHLAFGHGIHICLGRWLAMLEIKVMLLSLLKRTKTIELAGDLQWGSSIVKGITQMPIRVVWNKA